MSRLWRYLCFTQHCWRKQSCMNCLLFVIRCCNCTINIFKKQFKIKEKNITCVTYTRWQSDRNLKTSRVLNFYIFISVFFLTMLWHPGLQSQKRAQKFFFFFPANKNKFWLEQSKEQETSVNSQPFSLSPAKASMIFFIIIITFNGQISWCPGVHPPLVVKKNISSI